MKHTKCFIDEYPFSGWKQVNWYGVAKKSCCWRRERLVSYMGNEGYSTSFCFKNNHSSSYK